MRRYSEIPNTPTPPGRGGEPKVGALITIPNTGRAILRYVGPVEGKAGTFAGVELLGEGAALGKNSGDVNGVEYFRTSQPGAGLFMSYDKLLLTMDGPVESPKRASMVTSPGVRFNQTPSRQHSVRHQSTAAKRPSVVTRAHSSTPSLSTSASKSPVEKELQRVLNTKIVIENERDNLLLEAEQLKSQLRGAHDRLDENAALLKQIQLSYEDAQLRLEKANEKLVQAEGKLVKQRRVYEEQRKELLEVIDQVEAQVNDNERLYIGELKKLQEELQQKQQIIDDLQQNLTNLKDLYEEQKSGGTSGERNLDGTQAELQNLKLTNLTQSKAIEQLRADIREKEAKITQLSKESLELKQAHLTDKANMEVQLKEQKYTLEKLQLDVGVKESELLDIKEEMRVLKEKTGEVTRDIASSEDVVALKKSHDAQVSEMEKTIEELTKKLEASVSEDKVQELEFLLENKESIIADLRADLINTQNNSTSSEELDGLKKEIAEKSTLIESLQSEITELKSQTEELEKVKIELTEKDQKLIEQSKDLEEKSRALEEHTTKLDVVSNDKDVHEKTISEKDEELKKALKEITELKEKLALAELTQKEVEELTFSKKELEKAVEEKEEQVATLRTQIKVMGETRDVSVETESTEPEKSSESPELEEKILEIELLKEEMKLLKETDSQREIERLTDELKSLKKLNRYTTNRELLEQIQLLQKEISSRPSTEEVQQLRSELELVEQLRKAEGKAKDKEIYHLKERLYGRGSAPGTPMHDSGNDSISLTSLRKKKSQSDTSPCTSPVSATRPPVISQVVDGALQVYIPESKQDPGNGRKQWCGLCERFGHDSIDCPYENDIF